MQVLVTMDIIALKCSDGFFVRTLKKSSKKPVKRNNFLLGTSKLGAAFIYNSCLSVKSSPHATWGVFMVISPRGLCIKASNLMPGEKMNSLKFWTVLSEKSRAKIFVYMNNSVLIFHYHVCMYDCIYGSMDVLMSLCTNVSKDLYMNLYRGVCINVFMGVNL